MVHGVGWPCRIRRRTTPSVLAADQRSGLVPVAVTVGTARRPSSTPSASRSASTRASSGVRLLALPIRASAGPCGRTPRCPSGGGSRCGVQPVPPCSFQREKSFRATRCGSRRSAGLRTMVASRSGLRATCASSQNRNRTAGPNHFHHQRLTHDLHANSLTALGATRDGSFETRDIDLPTPPRIAIIPLASLTKHAVRVLI